MAERTIKIGSAGKIFSLTGWKVGWMIAAPEVVGVVTRAHQFLTFSTAPNLQSAVAYGLNEGSGATSADLSGNNNALHLSGISWSPGMSGGAIRFDGQAGEFGRTEARVSGARRADQRTGGAP